MSLKTAISSLFWITCLLVSGYLLTVVNEDISKNPPIVTYSVDEPSEKAVNNSNWWHGSDKHPLSLEIPSLGIDAYVQNVGVDQHKRVAVPQNINLAGWFANSALPGEPGLSVIDGHLNGRTKQGVFYKLPKIKAGDEIIVTNGGNTKLVYEVVDVYNVDINQVGAVLFSQQPQIKSQLNLVTCVGEFDVGTRQYTERFVVVSKLK